ncbi:MAG TPA: hypothetical protein VII75_01595 [Thermoanaerobaculia bacterium]|nr:hypothetical protein [Thermoanaerobaculia bacterium]
MLTSQLGLRLVLLLGKTVPLPASYDVMKALTRAEVTNDSQNGDGFQLTFALSKNQPVDYNLILSGALDPGKRVVIGVILGILPEVLIDGIITHLQVAPGADPTQSTLTVTGKDVSIMLDLEEKNEKYENQPDFLIVEQLILKYAQYGLLPVVTPTTDFPISIDRIPRQNETDFQFITRMAARNGFVFFVEPVTFGVNKAFWGPQSRAGLPQPALTIGSEPSANLKSLHFTQDALAPVATSGTFIEPFSGTTIPIPQLPSLRIPPLSLRPAEALRKTLSRDTANKNAASAATSLLAFATNAPDSIKGDGEVDSIRYGSVLRARKLVGVRGAGLSYDGNYYVQRVTHTITIGDYKQSFQLSREGTGALLPVVRPS